MNTTHKKTLCTILLAIGFLLMTGSSTWAKSDATRTVTSQEIRESAENYLINHLDWPPKINLIHGFKYFIRIIIKTIKEFFQGWVAEWFIHDE